VRHGVYSVASFTGPGCSACGSDTGSEYTYNDRRQITQSTDAKGNVTAYQYDDRGNRVLRTEAVGTPLERTTAYTYDPVTNKVATITETAANGGKITTSVYDSSGNPLSLTETGTADGSTVGRTTTYTYDASGRILSVAGPRTDVDDITTFTYYPNEPDQGLNRGYLYTVADALGHTTVHSEYNAFGGAEKIEMPTAEILLAYDAAGRPLNKSSNGLTLFTNSYDLTGRITRIDLPEGRFITYQYAANGKPSSVTDSLGNSIAHTYDSGGRKIKEEIFDPQNVLRRFIEYTYEETGDLDKTIYADGGTEDLNYDPAGNLIARINALGRTTSYSYDALNRLTGTTAPDGTVTAYGYDKQDNTVSVTDAEGRSTAFTYDGLGRKISRTSPDTGTTLYTYDTAGNLLTSTDANGITAVREYDALNRPVAVRYPDPSQDITYTYNENDFIGRLTSIQDSTGSTVYTYDTLGRMIREERIVDEQVLVTDYAYNDSSELTGMIYPSGRLITYERDRTGGIVSVSSTYDEETVTLAEGMTYLPFGPRTSAITGGFTRNNSYNQLYRLTRSSAGTVYDREYGYTPDGQVASVTDIADPAVSQAFTYDDLNRLIGAEGSYDALEYSYDRVGSRLSETRDGAVSSYSYTPGTNRLARVSGVQETDFTYDAVGNTVAENDTAFAYDQSNRIVSVAVQGETAAEYGYDSRNLRVKRTTDGRTVYAGYDRSGRMISEIDGQGRILYEYVYLDSTLLNLFSYVGYGDNPGRGGEDAPGQAKKEDKPHPGGKDTTPDPPGQERKQEVIGGLPNMPDHARDKALVFTGPVLYYYISDHLGTPQLVVDAEGQVMWQGDYLPFGEVIVTGDEVGNSIRFPGQYHDSETGLHYNWHRYYDPATGRYISADPIGLDGGINLYAYVVGNPVNRTDSRGLFDDTLTPMAIGALIRGGQYVAGALSGVMLAVALDDLRQELDEQRDAGSRSIPQPKKPKCGCTCICRADADGNMPGNITTGSPLFQFGVANAGNCNEAKKEAKREAIHKLGMKPKHVGCRCAGK
jgi:RHS repeat-associated protein